MGMRLPRRGWSFVLFILLAVAGYGALSGRNAMPEVFAKAQSLDQGEARSRDTGLPVLVFATADWCGACSAFKRGALRDAGVSAWIRENTIPVLVEFNDRSHPPVESERLAVKAIPTLIIMRDGREVSRLGGNNKADVVLAWLAEHTGAVADWKHANPGRPLPALDSRGGAVSGDEGSNRATLPTATPGG